MIGRPAPRGRARAAAGVLVVGLLAGAGCAGPATIVGSDDSGGSSPAQHAEPSGTDAQTPTASSTPTDSQTGQPSGTAAGSPATSPTSRGATTSTTPSTPPTVPAGDPAYWRNRGYPLEWPGTVHGQAVFVDGACDNKCPVSIKAVHVGVYKGSGTVIAVLYGHDAEGWPLQQFLFLYQVSGNRPALVSKATESLPEGLALCELAVTPTPDGGVNEAFSSCSGGPDATLVWRRDDTTLVHPG